MVPQHQHGGQVDVRSFDLGEYRQRFPEALLTRYGRTFDSGFQRIEERFAPVRSGDRELAVDDVMAIFDDALPFVNDWTKPDRTELAAKMLRGQRPVAELVDALRWQGYDLSIVKGIIDGLRELTLAALVLHHVYPDRFAMCSQHIASLLHVTGETVPQFYVEYCRELEIWCKRSWSTPGVSTVVDAEYGLWTWYRMVFSGARVERRQRTQFYDDAWVQERRSARIAQALGALDRIDLSRAYLETDPTIAAVIALREMEMVIRRMLTGRVTSYTKFHKVVKLLSPDDLPFGMTVEEVDALRDRRNDLAHGDAELDATEAKRIVDRVATLAQHRSSDGSASP